MKPASIISLIVAVFIVIAGLITCVVAQNMAQKSGQSLFSEIESGDNIRKVELSDANINKIQLLFNDAEVTVNGGAESSYIEFVNFKGNYYSLTSTSSLVSFDETPDIASMLTFWESGFSFKGLRYVLNLNRDDTDHSAKKEIRIYLTNESAVKQIEIKATTCTVNVNDTITNTDYLITAEDLTLNTNNIMTSSAISINTGKDIAPAKTVVFNSNLDYVTNLNINAESLTMDAKSFMCSGSASINFNTGSVSIGSSGNMKFALESESGRITVNSAATMSPCTVGTSGGNVSVITKSGNINVTTGALSGSSLNYN